MATVNKDFKVKNGLVVEGANATVNGFDVLTKATDDQNYIVSLIGGAATSENTPDTVVLRDGNGDFAAGTISAEDGFSGNLTGNVTGNVSGNVTGTVSDISNHDTDDLTEGSTNKYFTDQRALDATNSAYDAAGSAANAEYNANQFTTNAINALDTDDIEEGTANLYYTDGRARDAVSAGDGLDYNSTTGAFSADLGNGLQFDGTGQIEIDDTVVATDQNVSDAITTHDVSSGVHGVTGDVVGTTDSQTLSNKALGSNLDANSNKVINLAEPTQASDAATKSYVDSVAEGLHIHASVVALSDSNITLPTAPATVDGVTLAEGDRILLTGQTDNTENGIYVVINGTGLDLTRAADYNTAEEIQAGDFVFVSGGSTYASTGWVQENAVSTLDTDPIIWDQFSGAGTYLAGTGLTLNGEVFAIDESYTATRTFATGEVTTHSDLTSGVHGVTGDVVGTTDTQTLENKTLGTGSALGANLDAVNTHKVVNLVDPTSNQDAATKKYVDDSVSAGVGNIDSDDVPEGTNNLYFTDERAQDALAAAIAAGTHENIVITYDDNANSISFVAENGVDQSTTTDLDEGTNLYFTDERAQDAVAAAIAAGTHQNIVITYNDATNSFDFVAENGVDDSDTDDLDEGSSNLYFTDARAVSALEAVVPNFTEVDLNSVATQVAATVNVPTAGIANAHQFVRADYDSAEYIVKVDDGTHTEVSKILLTLDSSDNISITEYGIIGTNGTLGTVSATTDGTNVTLQITTANNNSDVTVAGTLIK